MKVYVVLIMVVLGILVLVPSSSKGEDDTVFFFSPHADDIPTDIVFLGESELDLKVVFSQECSDWSVEMESELFEDRIIGVHSETLPAGKRKNFGLEVNESAPLGEYSVPVYMNYTDVQGNPVSNTFNFTITYTRAFEVTEVSLPTSEAREFSIVVETYVHLDSLGVLMDSDGDIGISNESFSMDDVPEGTYPFFTSVFKWRWGSGAQEVGYHVIGTFNGRRIEQIESNIVVSVDWEEDDQEDDDSEGFPDHGLWIIAIVIALLIGVSYYLLIHRRRTMGS